MRILVALGGNAILQHGDRGTAEDQFVNVRGSCRKLVQILQQGHSMVVTHGNGPQVGDILLKNEIAKNTLPPMPLDVCGAESQGMVGYMMQRAFYNELKYAGLDIPVVTELTQTVVDPRDPAFKNPTKPVGPFYTALEASQLRRERGWVVVNDSGRGYRRVVPSPNPIEIVEAPAIRKLFDAGVLVIAAGGGGIPVVRDDEGKTLRGVEAVIDKDLASALLASNLGAEVLMILTDVEKVCLNYRTSNESRLDTMTLDECERYRAQGQFPEGSMGPKVDATVRFLKAGGRSAIITSLDRAKDALEGRAGTTVRP